MLRVKKGIAILRNELKAGRFIMADKAVMRVPETECRPSFNAVLKKIKEDDRANLPRVTVCMSDIDGDHLIIAENDRATYSCFRRSTEEVITDKRAEELAFAFAEQAKYGNGVYLHYFIGERAVMQAQLIAPRGHIPFWEVLSLNAEPVELLFVREMLVKLKLDYEVRKDEEVATTETEANDGEVTGDSLKKIDAGCVEVCSMDEGCTEEAEITTPSDSDLVNRL